MATISSAGALEGVDLTKVTNNAALSRLNAEVQGPDRTEDVAQISDDGMRQSAIATLAEAASRLTGSALWASTVASSDTPTAVTARAGTQTPSGSYQVQVTQLASAQVTSTATFSSLSTVVALGTLSIEKGSWDASLATFAPNPNWPKATVVLGPKNDTLDRVRDKINAAGLGIIATVVSDATGSRLVIRSTSTGADSGFKIVTEEGADAPVATEGNQDVAALSSLGFDPSSMGQAGMQLLQPATNARVSIDGQDVESPLNALESKSGLNLILKNTTETPAMISVEPDPAAIQQATESFAQAYNDVLNQGGAVADALQQGAAERLGPSRQLTELGRMLSRSGITRTPSGELQVNSQRLSAALQQDSDSVRQSQSKLAQQVLDDLPASTNDVLVARSFVAQPPTDMVNSASTSNALMRQRLLDQYQDSEASLQASASRA